MLASGCGDDGGSPGDGDDTGTDGNTSTAGTSATTMVGADTTMGGGDATTTTSGADTTGGPGTSTDGTTSGTSTTGGDDMTDSGGSSSGGAVVCMGMSFDMLTSVDNDLITNLDVSGVVSCNQDITVTATGGTACVTDDGAGGYYYTVESIELMDVPPIDCGAATVGIDNMGIVNLGDGMEVVVPQAGGAMVGNQSVQVQGDVSGMALGNPLPPTPLMDFNGVLPEGDAQFGATDTTMTYADDMTVIATAMPEVVMGITVTVTLTGLDGSITLAM